MADLTAEQLAELLPLRRAIADVMTRPFRPGVPGDLTDALTVAVAAYVGRQVAGLPEQLAELEQLRAALREIAARCACGPGSHGCSSVIARRALAVDRG